MKQVFNEMTADKCREAFAEDFIKLDGFTLNSETLLQVKQVAPIEGVEGKTKKLQYNDDLSSEINAIETFADALRFEETLSKKNKEKRDIIFKRVLGIFLSHSKCNLKHQCKFLP